MLLQDFCFLPGRPGSDFLCPPPSAEGTAATPTIAALFHVIIMSSKQPTPRKISYGFKQMHMQHKQRNNTKKYKSTNQDEGPHKRWLLALIKNTRVQNIKLQKKSHITTYKTQV
jgi:hypothetical protein